MTDSRRGRLMGRRRLQVIRHVPPEEVLVAMTEPPSAEIPAQLQEYGHDHPVPCLPGCSCPHAPDVSRETVGGPYVAGGQVPGAFVEEPPSRPPFDPAAVAQLQEPPPSLSRAQVMKLEALTAVWERQVRADGPPAPDATTFLSVPTRPPVPAPRRRTSPPAQEAPAVPTHPTTPTAREYAHLAQERAVVDRLAARPGRVSDWSSRHDPASLEYAVRDRLRHPVPLQDFALEHGPILDQGTTPPLSLGEASACVGMAVVAAANVLDVDSRSVYELPDPMSLLDEEDGRIIYRRAQDLDHVSGNTAGTSVLAGMKAGKDAGYWTTYLWGLGGTRDVAQALLQLRSPVVLGIPWGPSMDEPDAAGIITPAGPLRDGHAVCAIGIRASLTHRQAAVARGALPGPYFVLQQSRGRSEGVEGLVLLHHTHLSQLLRGVGEAGVPVSRWAVQ